MTDKIFKSQLDNRDYTKAGDNLYGNLKWEIKNVAQCSDEDVTSLWLVYMLP